jgi:hypothetical protein
VSLVAGCWELLHELRSIVGSSRFFFLAEPLSPDELEAALDQCNNSCPVLNGLRFSLFKVLPMEAKLCLLDIYNDILATGVVPQS